MAQLVEALSRDLTAGLRRCLGSKALLKLEYAEFEQLLLDVVSLFKAWDDALQSFKDVRAMLSIGIRLAKISIFLQKIENFWRAASKRNFVRK